jgi:hypothetical protein
LFSLTENDLLAGRIGVAACEIPNVRWRKLVQPGIDIPPHAAATAKAILAHQSDDLVDAVLAQELPKLTADTRTDREWVLNEFAEVRRSTKVSPRSRCRCSAGRSGVATDSARTESIVDCRSRPCRRRSLTWRDRTVSSELPLSRPVRSASKSDVPICVNGQMGRHQSSSTGRKRARDLTDLNFCPDDKRLIAHRAHLLGRVQINVDARSTGRRLHHHAMLD